MPQTVLIVDDNDMNMKLFCDLLTAHGYLTVKATDGSEALQRIAERVPDLILLDIQLPDISGLDVARIVKERPDLQHIPIVAITAFAMIGDKEKALTAGCDAYITKPIAVLEFIEQIRSVLAMPCKAAI